MANYLRLKLNKPFYSKKGKIRHYTTKDYKHIYSFTYDTNIKPELFLIGLKICMYTKKRLCRNKIREKKICRKILETLYGCISQFFNKS